MTQFQEPEFEPQDIDGQEDEVGDPAQAFEALRETVEDLAGDLSREMTTIRKGVEAAFDRFETFGQPADYSADLGRLVQTMTEVGARLKAVEASPILKNGPEHYARALERGGESLVRTAAQQFQNESRDFQRVAREMAGQMASARERRMQNRLLWIAGVAAFAAGVLATLFLPRLLPASIAPRVASLVMAERAWKAGMSLMEFGNPDSWGRVVASDQLIQANEAEVTACREAAAKAGKDQKCSITVAAPERQPTP